MGGNKGAFVEDEEFPLTDEGAGLSCYHLLLDEQAEQISAITDDVAQRARKIG